MKTPPAVRLMEGEVPDELDGELNYVRVGGDGKGGEGEAETVGGCGRHWGRRLGVVATTSSTGPVLVLY